MSTNGVPACAVPGICEELRGLQRKRAVVLRTRIMIANRLQAVVAGTLGYEARMDEKERRNKFVQATALIARIDAAEPADDFDRMVKAHLQGVAALDDEQVRLQALMVPLARQLPVAEWVGRPEQRGFGLLFLAIVVGEAGDLCQYANPAKLWRRLGCAPWAYNDKTLMGATWRAGKEGKLPAEEWESYGYSPRRRSIAYLIGEGIVRQNTLGGRRSGEPQAETEQGGAGPARPRARKADVARPGPYRAHYDRVKEEVARLHPDYPKLRCHRHAMLLATKRLLKALWKEWNRGVPGRVVWDREWVGSARQGV